MTEQSSGGLTRFGSGTVRPRGRGDGPRSGPPRARPLKYGKWRALALTSVYVLFGLHIAHWKLNGSTLAPLELNELMYTLEVGVVTAGFLLMVTLFLATAVVGRFFCSWACHILALEDLCAWLLQKLRIRVRPVRSRLMLLVPPAALFYMFVWPQIVRMAEGRPAPELRILTDEDGWASFVTTDFWRNLPDPWIAGLTFFVCGFAVIYFLGARSFCFSACPYGAIFAAVDRIAPGRIKLTGNCEQCGVCTAVCSSGVRVHEEIARFGKVVDVNCMKDLDCVSACPQEAIGFGFTRPALADSFSASGRRRLKYDFSFGEELILGLVFVATLLVFRGLYAAVPFLMTLGLAGIVSYLALLALRLTNRADVRFNAFRFKRDGQLTRAGRGFCAAILVFGLFFAHSAFIRYHEARGQRAFEGVRAVVESPGGAPPAESIRLAVRHLETAYRWGLFRPAARDQQLASLRLKSDDPAGAEPYLRRILAVDPGDSDSRLALAQLLAGSGRLDEAEAEARLTLATLARADVAEGEWVPSSAACHVLIGGIQFRRGEIEQAIASYAAAVGEDQTDVSTHMSLGELLAQRARYAEAAVHYRQVVSLEPALAVAHFNLGAALTMAGDPDGAIEAYRETLALLPDDTDARTNLALLLGKRGDLLAAAEQFRYVIELRPDLARPHFNLARVHDALGDPAKAEQHYRLAAQLDPAYGNP